jgi:SAM-dependent methyltransferase
MAWVKKMLNEGNSPTLLGEMPSYHNMLKWGNTIDEKIGLPDIWHKNVELNLAHFDTIPDRVKSGRLIADEIQNSHEKAVILVGASPILNDTWQDLLDVDRETFIIAATNSSAKFLIDHGVVPDYVFLADGQKGKWTLDLDEENLKIALVCSPFAEPDAIANWKNRIIVMPFHTDREGLVDRLKERFGEPISQAGNAFNSALAFFTQVTDVRIYIFMGNELSFKKSYYNQGASINDASMYFYATDVEGQRVKTLIPLFQYKIWLENFMNESRLNKYFFFNCSKGILGVDVDGSQMPCVVNADLPSAMQQIKEAFVWELNDDIVKSKNIYDLMFASGRYWPKNGAANWISMYDAIKKNDVNPFNKALDVGCGHGFAIYEMVARGCNVYGADIADNMKSWKELKIEDRCKIAPAHDMPYADGEFDMVVCSDVMEHVPMDYIDASVKEIARVGCERFWFVIATDMDTPGKYLMPSHLVIGDLAFWGGKIEAAGMKIIAATENGHHISIVARKEKING